MKGLCFLVLVELLLVSGCETPSKKNKLQDIEVKILQEMVLNSESKVSIIKELGEPAEKMADKWVYHYKDTPKIWLFFEKENLSFITFSVWKSDAVKNPKTLLKNISGQWKVVKEPMTNPHAAPSLCYLEDLASGQRVEVSSFMKSISQISFWRPNKTDESIKRQLMEKVGKEFCIGSSCSHVTSPDAWAHNHCEWLEKLVAKTRKVLGRKNKMHKTQ